jgi:hypothetical protein
MRAVPRSRLERTLRRLGEFECSLSLSNREGNLLVGRKRKSERKLSFFVEIQTKIQERTCKLNAYSPILFRDAIGRFIRDTRFVNSRI